MSVNWIPDSLSGYLEEPVEIEFSEWTPWELRNSISNNEYPGVYLIARFDGDEPPDGPARHTDSRLIYIGATGVRPPKDSNRDLKRYFKGIALRNRWEKFHRSAFEGKSEHAGGNSYRKSEMPRISKGLYVAAYTHNRQLIPLAKARMSVDPQYLEKLMRMGGEAFELSDPLNRALRLYVERRCLFEYALANNGKLPVCNKE